MTDFSYGPKVYHKQGGDALVLASGGAIDGEAGSRIATQGEFILPKTPGFGVKIDPDDPAFTWRDMKGPILASATGPNRPVLTAYLGSIEDYAFAANDHYSVIKFHIDHDDVPGSDKFIHLHWSHNGTDISGELSLTYFLTYAKGHGRGAFHAEKQITQTISGLNISNTPALTHRIDEVPLAIPGGSASLLDSNIIEPDGLILLHFDVPTIPTITGGAAKPFIHFVDGHYLSTNVGTKQRSPDFYS